MVNLPGFPVDDYIVWIAPGAALLPGAIGAGFTATSTMLDARSGYLDRLRLLPVSPAVAGAIEGSAAARREPISDPIRVDVGDLRQGAGELQAQPGGGGVELDCLTQAQRSALSPDEFRRVRRS